MKVYRHKVGTPVTEDELIFEEPDHRFFVDVSKTKDNVMYLFLIIITLINCYSFYRNL